MPPIDDVGVCLAAPEPGTADRGVEGCARAIPGKPKRPQNEPPLIAADEGVNLETLPAAPQATLKPASADPLSVRF